jgi:hypothetical protein
MLDIGLCLWFCSWRGNLECNAETEKVGKSRLMWRPGALFPSVFLRMLDREEEFCARDGGLIR